MYYIFYEPFIRYSAVIATILQFLSGVLVCYQYVHDKTTGEASALPFLFGLLSCGVWYLYGQAIFDDSIVLVNTVGFILMLGYVIVFYIFAFKRKELKKQILGCVMFSIFMTGYVKYDEDDSRVINNLGIVACSLTLMTVASPLVKLYYVIRVKRTDCLPFYMILMSFFVSTLWMIYGIFHEDTFLIVPNIIGVILATSQLTLFIIYPSSSPASSKSQLV